jgi:hypothetical protein
MSISQQLVENTALAQTFRSRALSGAAVTFAALVLTACGGGGAEVQQNPVTSVPPVSDYTGPAPATADVQAFKLNVWDNWRADNRCGQCHNEGGQTPMFARSDDVNLAYEAANPVVELSDPSSSRVVEKVAGGHNCWLSSDDACGDILTTWVGNWAGQAGAGGGRQIELRPPVLKDVGTTKNFPVDSGIFSTTVHPLLTTYCQGCHTGEAPNAQQPFFAASDPDVAYAAAKTKIDLDEPDDSRFVLRLRDEFHNCWDNCGANGTTMALAIADFAGQITATAVDPALVVSKALSLYDGTIAAGGNRYENAAIGIWEFKTGNGVTAFDTSGVEPALDLTLNGGVEWFGGWGLNVKAGGKVQGSTTASKKLHDMIKATGEYSIEAWVVPGNVTQEDARIVSYSAGTDARNLNLGQTLYNYDFFNRSDNTDANGNPQVSTPDADEILQASLQHVVATFDPVVGRQLFVNGELVAGPEQGGGGSLADWDDTFAFVLGNEVSGDRQWLGVLRLVAVHNRALTLEQITQNFDAGVGEKFFMLFSVEHLINVPESYILFEAAQWDSYAYLFNNPTFISLDGSAMPGSIPLEGLRIGLNGGEVPMGQAYAPLDTMITDTAYDPALGQMLMERGTVMPLEKGPDSDEFFLTFETLGSNTFSRPPNLPVPPGTPPDGIPQADIGVRTFEEISATMSYITGVSPTDSFVQNTYNTVLQSLPAVETIEAFLSSHQVAIAQLAIEYCNSLVEDTVLRTSQFPGFDFNGPVTTSYSPVGRDLLLEPLLDRALSPAVSPVASNPDRAQVKGELNNLIDRLTVCGGTGSCDADRTATVAKSACAAVTGSAAMLVQ